MHGCVFNEYPPLLTYWFQMSCTVLPVCVYVCVSVCVDNVETKCLQLPHPPPRWERERERERGPPPLYIRVHVRAGSYDLTTWISGSWLSVSVCMQVCVCVCAGVCVCVCALTCMCSCVCLEGEPLPSSLFFFFFFNIYCNRTSLPSFAIGCYGNKGTEWSGCSSWRERERERQREKTERERERFIICNARGLNHNNRFNRVHMQRRAKMSTPQREMRFGCTHMRTHTYQRIN